MNQLHDDVRLTYVIELIELAIIMSTTKPAGKPVWGKEISLEMKITH